MTQNYIGVDLSSGWIDIHDPLRGVLRIINSSAALAAWMDELGCEDFLVFEATSGCDRAILQEAQARGIAMRRINPLHGWHFGRSLNLPKTGRCQNAGAIWRGAAARTAGRPVACTRNPGRTRDAARAA